MSKHTIYTSRVSQEKQSHDKRYEKPDMKKRLATQSVSSLAKAFHMESRGKLENFHVLESVILFARNMKHKAKVA